MSSQQPITKQQQVDRTRFAMVQFSAATQGNPVQCECGISMLAYKMFRCLYCGIYFCQKCAEIHFGKTRKEWMSEQVIIEEQI